MESMYVHFFFTTRNIDRERSREKKKGKSMLINETGG
jgi:hypothetical protein